MVNRLLKIIRERQTTRHYARVMAFAILGVVLGAFLVYQYMTYVPRAPHMVEQVHEEIVLETDFQHSAPKRLIIPKANIDTTFVEPLGLNEDRTVSVPDSYEEVGWYKHGATPGEIGSSVILGHVDSLDGAAVFYSLGQLEVGDEVEVQRSDGSTAIFVVTELERVKQSEFPTEKVYGKVDHAGLRLVTCTGLYDRGTLRYSHNLIVYAELKEDQYLENE